MKDVIDLTNVLELLDCEGVSKIEIPDGYITKQGKNEYTLTCDALNGSTEFYWSKPSRLVVKKENYGCLAFHVIGPNSKTQFKYHTSRNGSFSLKLPNSAELSCSVIKKAIGLGLDFGLSSAMPFNGGFDIIGNTICMQHGMVEVPFDRDNYELVEVRDDRGKNWYCSSDLHLKTGSHIFRIKYAFCHLPIYI